MAKKMYYTEEETAAALGVSAADLAGLAGEGKLRVYKDGARSMYSAEDVDALSGGGEPDEIEIELAPADSTADMISLADSVAPPPAGKEDTVITAEGISIFDDEDLEIEAADPMAKTQIAPTLEDQVSLEGVGSGSGLLDLTQESDDTSFGPEVLEHIDMEGVGADLSETPAEAPAAYAPQAEATVAEPAVVEMIDSTAGLFNGMIIGCAIVAMLLGGVALTAITGAVPEYVETLKDNLPVALVICFVLIALTAGIGMYVGKNVAARREAMRRAG